VLIGISGQNYGATRGFLVGSDIYEYKRTLLAPQAKTSVGGPVPRRFFGT